MPIKEKDCFELHGRNDLSLLYKNKVDGGMNEKQAAREVILDDHEKAWKDMEKLKGDIVKNYKPQPYSRPDNSKEIQAIHDQYKPLIEQAAKPVEQVPAKEKSGINETADQNSGGTGNPPPSENPPAENKPAGGENKVGVSHAALTDLADRLGLKQPERGEYLPPEWYADRGRKLLAAGADLEEVNNPKNELHDRISIGRAHLENLVKSADDIAKSNPEGVNSDDYKKAWNKLNDYSEKIKELGRKAHQAMVSLQGERDVNTDSFTAVKKNLETTTGEPASKAQEKKIKDLTDQNNVLKKEAADLEAKLTEATEKATKETDKKQTVKEKSKSIADKIRKAKIHRPGMFSAATPASIAWDGSVEVVAKAVETGGKIADAIEKGIKYLQSTNWYKQLNDSDKKEAEKQFKEWHEEQSAIGGDLDSLQKMFINKKDNKFSIDEAKSIWDYAKTTYLDKGVSYRDMISNVGNDLGLSWKQVSSAITSPKVKRISDEMWKKQADYRRNQTATKNWIDSHSDNPAIKALKKVSGVFRGISVFGHGGIFVGTHAAPTLFQPSTWKYTIPAFIRGWKFAYGNKGNYERAMNELKNTPNYVLAQRAGLKNNPDAISTEEYQKSQKFLGKLGLAGQRGFNAIKVLRQNLFDFHYNKLSPEAKADPKSAENVAKLVNNATGATNLKIPEWVNEITFAGGMEAARWGKLTRNPLKATSVAIQALVNPDKVSVSDRVFAKVWAKRVGEQVGTFAGLLVANAAIQNTLNPTNPVNMTNPDKPDFLKFKFGDITLDPTSGMRGTGMFVYGLGKIPFENQKQLKGDTRMQAAGKSAAGYGRGKLAPLYSTIADFFTQQDYNKNPLPFSSDKPTAGHHKLTWTEYGWEHAPLPIAEAAQTTYQSAVENSGDKSAVNNVLNGILLGALSGGTGMRFGEYNAAKSNHSPFSEEDKKDPTFKYFTDKGMELPNTSLSLERIKDNVAHTDKTISSYPQEKQDEYLIAHKEIFKDELEKIKDKGVVYVKEYKDENGNTKNEVDINRTSRDQEEKSIDDLSKDELKKLSSIMGGLATTKAKKRVFGR